MRHRAPLAVISFCLVTTLFAFPLPNAFADIASVVSIDTPTQLQVDWWWWPEEEWVSALYLVNWQAHLMITEFSDDEWMATIEGTHYASPHGEAEPGYSYRYSWVFDKGVFSGGYEHSSVESHTPHHDEYLSTFFHGGEQGSNIFSLSAEHVIIPEPATLLLLGTGLAGLAGFSRRRKRR